MSQEINSLKKSQKAMKLLIVAGLAALSLSIIKNIATEYWALNRDYIACTPVDVDHSEPMVYRQSISHPVEMDSLLKSFVYDYVHLTADEDIVDYHARTSSGRYGGMTKLSRAKWAAVEMSWGAERALNQIRYGGSDNVYHELEQKNMGWIFLIDDLQVMGDPTTGSVLAVVRGQYQVTYDKVKVDLPAKLSGYHEIYLLLNQEPPTTDAEDKEYENKYGWFVTWSSDQILTPAQKKLYSERTYDYYILEELK